MIHTTVHGHVSVVELQREDRRNALNTELCHAIRSEVDAAVDAGARVIVITGRGTAFCSGADLSGVYGPEFLDALYGMLHHLTRVRVPIVAAVNGPAIGAGTQLAIACDLRVASPTAAFAVPTARNGMAVDAWTIRALATIASGGAARRLMLAAETFDTSEAVRVQLVDRTGSLDDAITWAHELAALAPLTHAHNKLVLNGGSDAAISETFAACWASGDLREALDARSAGRPPVFTGR